MTPPDAPESSASGLLELGAQGGGHLRLAQYNFLPRPEDVHVSSRLIQQYQLREGQFLTGPAGRGKPSRRNNRRGGGGQSMELTDVVAINGHSLDSLPPFRNYTDL